MEGIDMERACRTCLREGERTRSVFVAGERDGETCAAMVAHCTTIKFIEGDGLPLRMCQKCFDNVTIAFAFKTQAEKADAQLKSYIARKRNDCLGSIKEETFNHHDLEFKIKTENKNELDGNSDNYDSTNNDVSMDMSDDDDDEDMKPLKDLANRKLTVSNESSKVLKRKLSECNYCHKTFSGSVTLDKHIQKYHKGDMRCNICSKAFTSMSQLDRHRRCMHSGDRSQQAKDIVVNEHSCKQCHFTFIKEVELITHIAQSHSAPRKRGRPPKNANVIKVQTRNQVEMEEVESKNSPALLEAIADNQPDEQHKLSMHCNYCSRSFQSFDLYETHLKNHIAKKLFACQLCNATFSCLNNGVEAHFSYHEHSDSYLNIDLKSKIHLISDHRIGERKLEDLSDEEIINMFKADMEEGFYNQYLCEIKFDSDQEQENSDTETVNKKLKAAKKAICDICDKAFVNNSSLQRHKMQQHSATGKTFKCDTCGLSFAHEMMLNKHILKCHKGESVSVNFVDPTYRMKKKSFVCQTCSKAFYSHEHLERHKRVHMPHAKIFECVTCKKKFNRRDNLKSHMRIHDKNRVDLESNCLCVYCGRSFSNSSNLIVHMRRHTGEKPYKCDICGKGFPRSSDLQCHRRTHTGEKPCLCTICGKGFSRSNKLVRHMRIHTGQRPYKCSYCSKAFTQSNDLTLHIRRHTGDKPYVCGTCGDRFIQGTALQVHRRIHGHYEPGGCEKPPPANSVNNLRPKIDDKTMRPAMIKFDSDSVVTFGSDGVKTNSSTPSSSSNTSIMDSRIIDSKLSKSLALSYMANGASSFSAGVLTGQSINILTAAQAYSAAGAATASGHPPFN